MDSVHNRIPPRDPSSAAVPNVGGGAGLLVVMLGVFLVRRRHRHTDTTFDETSSSPLPRKVHIRNPDMGAK
jgi:hypothetical protein